MKTIGNRHLTGNIFYADDRCGEIISITYPEGFSDITVVDATLLGESNYLDVYGNSYRIFAEKEIIYPNQPVCAVFGPSSESVELFKRKIKIEIGTKQPFDAQKHILEWNTNLSGEYFDQLEDRIEIKSRFAIRRHQEVIHTDRVFFADFENETINLSMETLWPAHVRETLSKAFNLAPENIEIDITEAHPGLDQLAYKPSALALITAMASKVSGLPALMSEDVSFYHPQLEYSISSVVDKTTSEILATKVLVSADMGAVYVFEDEMAMSLLAGVVSLYKTKVTEVRIETYLSENNPSNLFRGLGYSPSVAAMEHHVNIIAKTLGLKPEVWRLQNLGSGKDADCSSIFEVTDDTILPKMIQNCISEAQFSRKNAVYSQNDLGARISPVLNYTRGIGLAAAGGVSGFSFLFRKLKDFNLTVTQTDEDNMILDLGIYGNESVETFWKKTVTDTLPQIRTRSITIEKAGTTEANLGPAILSRSTSLVPTLIRNACLQIKQLHEDGREYPISVHPELEQNPESSIFYKLNSFGALAIDLYIDPVRLIPVVYAVTASFSFCRGISKKTLEKELRQIISQTIKNLCPDATTDYSLTLSFTDCSKLDLDSGISLARGITMASLATALSQALNHEIYKLPITAKDILGIIRLKEQERK